MALYICGSNRKGNSARIINDLRKENDKVIFLDEKEIKYCSGCNSCMNDLTSHCIIQDDMKEVYEKILETEKIVIVSPIYMNHITGLLKNVIDRFNPFSWHDDLLQGKTIYLITVGQMDEEENKEIEENIKEYFESIGEFMGFNTIFLKNFSSGDIQTVDDITKVYENYDEIIKGIRNTI